MRYRSIAWLVLAAELGHLTAAWTEARAWPLISGFHILVACALGFVFAGLRKPEPRRRTIRFATVLAIALPVLYLLTRVFGLPTILSLTRLDVEPVGVVVTALEVGLAVVLLRSRRTVAAHPPSTAEATVASVDTVRVSG
jgi:hypothetical protein